MMHAEEHKKNTEPEQTTFRLDHALNWQQQLQMEGTTNVPAHASSPMTTALEECEVKFLLSLPASELQSAARLFMNIEQAYWYYDDHLVDAPESGLKKMDLEEFALELFEFSELLSPLLPNFGAMFQAFNEYKLGVPVYRCILLNEELTHVVMVRRWKGDKWNFPKGKVNEDEDEAACAAREVNEETGYLPTGLSNAHCFTEVFHKVQRCKLFLHSGVSMDYPFKEFVYKEISEIRFVSIDDPPPLVGMAIQFVRRLKRWRAEQKVSSTAQTARIHEPAREHKQRGEKTGKADLFFAPSA
jgi:mRNA-decapping enzyme subunit 2